MSTSDVNQSMATLFMPEQASPPIPAAGTADACALYCDGANLMLSVNGGAYAAIVTGSGSTTLNAAYANGPAGNTISMTDALGAVTLSSARTSGAILAITTTTVPAAITGAIAAVSIDMSSLGAAGSAATTSLQAVSITGPFSAVVKSATTGLVRISSAYRNAQAINVVVKNKQALAGSIVSIGWDTTNYEGAGTPGAPANTTLTGQTHVLTIDAQTNVTAGAQTVVGASITIPASSSTSTRGVDVASTQTAGFAIFSRLNGSSGTANAIGASDERTASTGGAVFWGGTGSDSLGNAISVSGTFAGRSAYFFRYGNFTATGSFSVPVCEVSIVTNMNSAGGQTLTLNQPILKINHAPTNGGAGTITDTSVGILVTMTPASASSVVGVSISMANASAQGAALTIAHSGTNANQLVFTSAIDGTGSHIYGPTSAAFYLKAGQPTGTTAGRDIYINASNGSTTGAGGSIYLSTGGQAGGTLDGTVEIVQPNGSTGAPHLYISTSDDGSGSHILGPTGSSFWTSAGTPAIATTSTPGNDYNIRASDAVAGSSVAGAAAGGDVGITAGAAARLTSGNANGGDIYLVCQAGVGTGRYGRVDFSYPSVALGGGAAATLGTIGGSGPAAAAQSEWLEVKVNGNIRWIPVWA